MSTVITSAARVIKTIGFSLEEWAVIERLMRDLDLRQFTVLCKVAMKGLAETNGYIWPED